jgi:hypothetical protein
LFACFTLQLSLFTSTQKERKIVYTIIPVQIKQVVGEKNKKSQANRHAPDSGAILYSKQN